MKAKETSLTYCNPIPLPDYPRGRMCRPEHDSGSGWLNNGRWHDFRETADPSVLYHDNKWFLYPSAGMAWVSEDFTTWKHVKMNLYDIGYAPTIMRHTAAASLRWTRRTDFGIVPPDATRTTAVSASVTSTCAISRG